MKKLLSVFLCAVLVILCFSGCKNDNIDSTLTQTTTPTIQFTYDSYYNYYDNSVIRNYESVCQAIVEQQSNIRINTAIYQDVTQLLYTSFPLIDLVADIKLNDDHSGIVISYAFTKADHDVYINDFSAKIAEIKSACGYGTVSTNEYILNLYKYISSSILITPNSTITLYQTITTGKGSSFTFSRMFEYILHQSGVEASHVIAFDQKDATWGLSIVKIDDSYYYFDVTKEYKDNRGTKLKFFAMSEKDAIAAGLTSFKYSDSKDVDIKIADTRFSACHSADSYSVTNNVLTVTDSKGTSTDIPLQLENNTQIIE